MDPSNPLEDSNPQQFVRFHTRETWGSIPGNNVAFTFNSGGRFPGLTIGPAGVNTTGVSTTPQNPMLPPGGPLALPSGSMQPIPAAPGGVPGAPVTFGPTPLTMVPSVGAPPPHTSTMAPQNPVSCTQNRFRIVSSHSGLIMDACGPHVKLQAGQNTPTQLWSCECLPSGNFNIVNVGSGNALDVEGGACRGAKLTTAPKNGAYSQQWRIDAFDNTIVNPMSNLAISVDGAGGDLVVSPKDGGVHQKFCFSNVCNA